MAGYKGVAPVPQATQTRMTFTATAGQTDFVTMGYQPGYVDVYLNGVKLVDGDDYTATDGATVTLAAGAATDDVLEVVAFTAFEVASMLSFSTTVTGDYTVPAASNPTTVNVNAASATITLPAATVVGRRITVRKVSASAGTVTINRAGSDTITRATLTSVTLTSNGDFWTLECVASGRWDLVDGYETISGTNDGIKRHDGTMEQWGNIIIGTATVVTFESEFTADPQLCMLNRAGGDRGVNANPINSTNFTGYAFVSSTGIAGSTDARWIAIGRWYA